MRWTKSTRLRLHRTSIRNRLLFGVVTLAFTTILLTAIGLGGFYRYRSLAESVSQRATELPLATELSLWASTASSGNTRICQMISQQQMIDSSLVGPTALQMEQTLFEQAMLELRLIVDRYVDKVGTGPESVPVQTTQAEIRHHGLLASTEELSEAGLMDYHSLVSLHGRDDLFDINSQRASLAKIASSLNRIETMRRDPRSIAVYAHSNQNELGGALQELVNRTHEHLSLMHGQMGAFSDEVRGEHRIGISLAWGMMLLTLTIALAMMWYFQTTVIEPFRNLVDGCKLTAGGQFDHRIELGTVDELSELAEAMNSMTDRFQEAYGQVESMCSQLDQEVQVRSREVIRNEQLASVGFLAAGFAHEINNPMATIAWSAEALEGRVSDLMMLPSDQRILNDEFTSNLKENLARIQSEAFRCKSITEKMLDFSRMGDCTRTETEIGSIVVDVAAMVGTVGKYRCKTIRVDAQPNVHAHSNAAEIRQVVLNLITNALESVDPDGAVDVHVYQENDDAVIRVCDDGCGMTPEVLEKLFEPFFTRRRDNTGTGLGLSITSRIVSQHGGSLQASSEGEGCGSQFVLRLPKHPVTDDQPNTSRAWRWNDVKSQAA